MFFVRMAYLYLCLLISTNVVSATNQDINLTRFSSGELSSWEEKSFLGNTRYQITELDNRFVLKAHSDSSASGLAIEQKIDLLSTPYMSWSWLTKSRMLNLDEHSKEGDDYVARIYVVKKNGWFIWQTKAINYVWSSNQPKESQWPNAYAGDKAQMIAIRGTESNLNQWYDEKRNVYNDFIELFGDKGSDEENQKAYRYIDMIAIMTDTDNGKQEALSYYGDIIFSEQ
ncbi:DUF3047 domain-containing protein [Vibrio sp. HN007]|uniref:DUF3047 domain-containing protein n=1 Tax=Vibrio iocasae TaxID=3098914 RepID=UPI0035D45602